ncbi:MAG: triosephosphate isomerase, partial [Desulfobacula sp.]|nr:triosephosphate isomerase [Desulfobacula sp.]
MIRQPLIAGNWKMYKTGREAVQTATTLGKLCSDVSDVEVMIAPGFLSLALVAQALKKSPIKLGAQNLYFEKEGAFTGEVSADMIKDAGAEYVLVGHSERRQYFGETDESVNKKMKAAFNFGIIPIVCVGETLKQRE